ncbi:MAG: DUF4340 domain-containing protein [Clostridia bacterium]|nr:DUF4340 domain-containing protein [Clostridia bacterium]
MRKNTKRLVIGGIAVVILGGIYAGLTLIPEKEDASSETESVSLVSMDTDDLASVHVSLESEDYTLQFTHDDSGTAYTMSGGEETADYSESLMQELMNNACSVSARLIAENCDDLSEYGLSEDDSTTTVEITDTDGATTVLTFGLSSDILSGTYCMKDTGDTVYLLDSDTASSLTQSQSYYRNLTVLGSYYSLSSELQTLTIDSMSDGSTITIQARDISDMDSDAIDFYSDYVFTAPISCDADDYTLSTGILSDLQDALTAQAIVEDNPSDLSKYGLDTPRAKIGIKTNSLDATVLVGSTDDDQGIYLMKEGGSTVFLSTASDFNFLSDDWNDWRSTNLMPCALVEIDSITVTEDDMVYEAVLTVVPGDEDEDEDDDGETITATLNGETMTDDALQQLYLAVSSVNYTRLLEEPETAEPEVTVTLTMTDGSTRSLAFAKGGSREYLVSVNDGGFAYGVHQDDLTSILDALTTGSADDDTE